MAAVSDKLSTTLAERKPPTQERLWAKHRKLVLELAPQERKPHVRMATPFSYLRTVHFADTDAAGVVFFANYLAICHEAYEESLAAAGLELSTFFAQSGTVVPITKSEAEYHRPLACGDRLRVSVTPTALSENSYEVRFEIFRLGSVEKRAARVRTEHICITTATRARAPLPALLAAWVHHV